MMLTDDSDAKAAVIDAGCAEMGTGPMYPPPPAETELLPGLPLTVVKPDAVFVVGIPCPVEPVEPAPAEPVVPVPAPALADPLPVEPLPVDPLPVLPTPAEPVPV